MLVQAYANTEQLTRVSFQVQAHYGNSNGKLGNNAFKGKTQGSSRGHNRVCTQCGRTNHIVEKCSSNMVIHQVLKVRERLKISPQHSI